MTAPSSALGRPRRMHAKRSLATLLREHGVLSVAHASDLALDICDQLASAHDRGVVHGQLGLRCIRLVLSREDGPQDVEIFTLTAETDGPVEDEALPYLAPEQRDLTRPIDGRADIFGIGAILYHVLVGQPPPAEMLDGSEPVVVPLDEMPSSLASILEDCLAPEPEARPRDLDELTEKIASFATWPPDRFARLAERREARASAERARRALEARGLANMPDVLDRLDDAALERANRESATVPKAALATPAAPVAMSALDRLMAVVHEGTEAARVDHAENLPELVDFDDEDDEGQETVVKDPIEETIPLPLEIAGAVQSGVTVPLAMPEPPAPLAAPSNAPSVFLSPSLLPLPDARPASRVALAGVAIAACLAVLTVIFFLTRPNEPSITMTTSAGAAPSATTTPPPTPAVTAAPPPTSTIPVFSPQSLPEVAPVTPGSLPNAKP